ncbi:MAG: carbohydrate kinase family protein [Patescibacteria group bacterium]|jgi:ribokinase
MYDILTLGSAARDAFLVSKAFTRIDPDPQTPGAFECIPLGEKVDLDQCVISTGGGATNAAVTFARLGMKTGAIVRVGKDDFGDEIIRDLKNEHIETTFIKRDPQEPTAFSVLLTAPDGERSALVWRGASAHIHEKDIPFEKLKARWMYIASLGGDLALAQKVIRYCVAHNIRTCYNPGAQELKKGIENFSSIIRNLTIMNINLEEAQLLLNTESRDVVKLCRGIAQKDLLLVITDGPRGAYAFQNDALWFVRPEAVKVISSTGAGDAFGSGFLAALMEEYSIEDALRYAMHNAQSVIQYFGAKKGILKKIPGKKRLQEIKVRKLR